MHIANEIIESMKWVLQWADSSAQKWPPLQMSMTWNDNQEMFLPMLQATRQSQLWILWPCGIKLQQEIYCQTEKLSIMVLSGMYSVYFSLCLFRSPLFYAFLADCNSVNDFDLSCDWGQEPQRESREMVGDESRVGGWL